MKDIEEIRRDKVECAFLKVAPDNKNDFYVLVWHHLDVSNVLA
jgi:hypothetical protein